MPDEPPERVGAGGMTGPDGQPGLDHVFDAAGPAVDALLRAECAPDESGRTAGLRRVLVPRAWSETHRGPDPWYLQAECLYQGTPRGTLRIAVKCRQLARGSAQRAHRSTGFIEVEQLRTGDSAYVTGGALTPREITGDLDFGALAGKPHTAHLEFPGEESTKPLTDRGEDRLVRECWPVDVTMHLSITAVDTGLWRLRFILENTTMDVSPTLPRTTVLYHSLVAVYAAIGVGHGRFLSVRRPPDRARDAAGQCRQHATRPVLADGSDASRIVLCGPENLDDDPIPS
ncbi:hypothetical protein GCM10022222_59410 [Amycolatopsis ultiminotia]|uniref:Uncharacterized protein n=1 Tax=Amycolatopsis ultiminotia TaxID=543629 RepID=A0ABP6XJY7_9PSEU